MIVVAPALLASGQEQIVGALGELHAYNETESGATSRTIDRRPHKLAELCWEDHDEFGVS